MKMKFINLYSETSPLHSVFYSSETSLTFSKIYPTKKINSDPKVI